MFRNERRDDRSVIRYCREAENPLYRVTPNTLPLAWFEGVALCRSGDPEASLKCYSRALKSTPYEVRVLNDFGVSLYQLHRISDAKSYFIRSVELDPWFDDARFNLGAIYYWSGQADSAFFYVRKCRESKKKENFLKELQHF
jgi:Flp pilus assembly protein TadD